MDATIDRLMRHMAWANAGMFDRLSGLPDSALELRAPNEEWTVARILRHLVDAATGYAARLEGTPRPGPGDPPSTIAELPAIARACAAADTRLREAATLPEGTAVYMSEGQEMRRARSTILAQAVHHATEHRAQIAGALSANGIRAIDLDALDVWAYGDAEGLGA